LSPLGASAGNDAGAGLELGESRLACLGDEFGNPLVDRRKA
jgi:hypothetical protein